jgi:uncharacterized membrane protein
MKCSDSVSIWLNIICMMFASLLPFSTSLLAEYIGQQLPILIYEGNYFMLALLGYLNWLYVTGKYRLVDTDIDLREVRQRKILFMSGMVYAAIAMGVSYLNTIASMSIFVVCLVSGMISATVRLRVRATEQVAK